VQETISCFYGKKAFQVLGTRTSSKAFDCIRVLKPRTIRGQLIAGLIAFEIVLVVVFAFFVIHEHARELQTREMRRLEYQSNMGALMVEVALADGRPDIMRRTIALMMQAPSIRAVQVTDPHGRVIQSSSAPGVSSDHSLTAAEREYLDVSKGGSVFAAGDSTLEAVAPVYVDGRLSALVWIYPSEIDRRREMNDQFQLTIAFGVVGAVGCVLLAEFLARSITRPLSRLLAATRRLIRDPEDTATLPMDSSASSEVADLTLAFNLMVASIEEQRSGLNDTLALLDSMLAHAPVGVAFFDNKSRFVRINKFLANMNGLPVGKLIGRGAAEVLPGGSGQVIEASVRSVFETSEPVRDLEVNTRSGVDGERSSTWLVNVYPVRTDAPGVRWVGAVIVDTTEIKRSEDALRNAEKLAVVGQLASSIAHEINNPLEAITNILYLLHRLDRVDPQAMEYIEQAEHEVMRMSEIVRQTLRFHRQSTRKTVTGIADILDSVLTLHRGRVAGLQVEVERRYEPGVNLYCFAGEMRQLFANLVGNALDAMIQKGGQLTLTVRRSHSWREPAVKGVRVMVADTGSGMPEKVQRRIFEAFFTTKEATGTGLGLWVSAEIIQKHGGTVRVRSRSANETTMGKSGTVFMVFLPDAPVPGELPVPMAAGAV
jgi:PAS domain S-box-containing protein